MRSKVKKGGGAGRDEGERGEKDVGERVGGVRRRERGRSFAMHTIAFQLRENETRFEQVERGERLSGSYPVPHPRRMNGRQASPQAKTKSPPHWLLSRPCPMKNEILVQSRRREGGEIGLGKNLAMEWRASATFVRDEVERRPVRGRAGGPQQRQGRRSASVLELEPPCYSRVFKEART
jgi:hypothetical protein